jgi:hypothetical protein
MGNASELPFNEILDGRIKLNCPLFQGKSIYDS